jgi:ribonucleoside-diphosphate reductase alpha chain
MKKYNYDEVYQSTLKYFNGDELATKAWINKYCLKDYDNNYYEINPNDMHKRISNELARIESNYPNGLDENDIFNLLKDFKYIVPQGSPMSGIGNNLQTVSLSNCYVVGNDADSYGGIFITDQEQAQLMKRRGGVGHDLSHIRPKNSKVNNSALNSTGIVPFMERFSNTTREVAQDGRRGALMLSCSINHPDAEDFIDAKLEDGKITGANVSVRISDDFMESVVNNRTHKQKYPIDSENPFVVKDIDAKKLWDKIIHNAWRSAEPGILFWDTIIRESVPDCYADLGFKTSSTNPCGEIPLCPYDSCRLLALNLYSYVINPFTKDAKFDYELFKQHAIYAQRFMDDIVDLEIEKINKILQKIESDPEDKYIKDIEKQLWLKIKDKTIKGRRTGLGITSEGDMLAAMGITYGTKEATDFSENIHKILAIQAYKSSCILAKERGSFPIYDYSRELNNPFISRLKSNDSELDMMLKEGRRNIGILTAAPTGTVSLMTQTTSGIEPAFLIYYKRRRKINPNDKNSKVDFVDEVGDKWEEYNVFHHKFLTWLEVNGYNVDEVKQMKENEISSIIEKSPYYKATSNDVDWLEKVRLQGAIQKFVDHSISVTINLPENVTEDLVSKVYMEGWKSGCKGVTIYRDNSRSGVLVSNKKSDNPNESIILENNAPKRPKTLECDVIRFTNKGEKWIGFIGLVNGLPYEIFTGLAESFVIPTWIDKGIIKKEKIKNKDDVMISRYDFIYIDKEGYEVIMTGLNRAFNREYWNIGKMTSALLRHHIHLPSVINIIDSLKLDGDVLGTWKKGVIRMLKKYIKDEIKVIGKTCESCGSTNLVNKEGCISCLDCGWSKCT